VRRPPRRNHQQGDHQHRVQPQDQCHLGLDSCSDFDFGLCVIFLGGCTPLF
jgi:hypothetical protein